MKVLRILGRCLVGVGLMAALCPAQAQINLANYGTNHLIKFMAMGDSITDDCETDGAWRYYLQLYFKTNGIPFDFMGRNISSSFAGFSQTNQLHHEGFCGATIAYPGEYAVYQYPTASNYLENIVVGAMAITNNRPDVMLILIGANDSGYGRNPWHTATNDMSNLLNLVFSYVPNAVVFISKNTSLQSASILGFGNYATNVPIYNAQLEALVNQRRALGQQVYLTDMYSSVAYSTMFMSDHVHPNATGLAAMGQEWYQRINAVLTRTNQVTTNFIRAGDTWSFNDSGQDLSTNWLQPGYDDSSWLQGEARFGYGEETEATTLSFGPEITNMYPTTYFLRPFVVPDNVGITNLYLRVNCVDGAVVYLNGAEIYRTNMPTGPIAYTNLAKTAITGFNTPIFRTTNITLGPLSPGTNWLAAEIHKSTVTNAQFGFNLELFGTGYIIPPPTLTPAVVSPTSLSLTWPATNSVNYTLYSTSDLTTNGVWGPDPDVLQTNNGQVTATISPTNAAGYYRLQHP